MLESLAEYSDVLIVTNNLEGWAKVYKEKNVLSKQAGNM
ncbi:glycerophosphoryl diester phosphodiesterase [Paenibacillus sp. JCM 10914]|nr:glycerophosphoryl diester phosphodiesterase [Paenibacillus sp. JCM 10914]